MEWSTLRLQWALYFYGSAEINAVMRVLNSGRTMAGEDIDASENKIA